MIIYVLVIVFVLCAVICHWIAKRRRASVGFWAAMGTLFGPLAIPFACCAKPRG